MLAGRLARRWWVRRATWQVRAVSVSSVVTRGLSGGSQGGGWSPDAFSMWTDADSYRGMVRRDAPTHAAAARANARVGYLVRQVEEAEAKDEGCRAGRRAADPEVAEARAIVSHVIRLHRYVFRRHCDNVLSDAALEFAAHVMVLRYRSNEYVLANGMGSGHFQTEATALLPLKQQMQPADGGAEADDAASAADGPPGAVVWGFCEPVLPNPMAHAFRNAGRMLTGRSRQMLLPTAEVKGSLMFQQSQHHSQEGFDKLLLEDGEVFEEGFDALHELFRFPIPLADVVEVAAAAVCTWPHLDGGVDLVRAPLVEHIRQCAQ